MNQAQMIKMSKKISYALRHHPEKFDLKMDAHGWVCTEQLIAAMRMHDPSFTKEDLDFVVENNDKHRFSYNDDETAIRANQGHSIPVDVEMKQERPPQFLYHGTGEKYVASIMKEGLCAKGRLYVHLSGDPETAYKVGSRHGRPYVFTVQAERMYLEGHTFYISENGVWQVGYVPVEYLKGEE